MIASTRVVSLSGGTGGAKLCTGLYQILSANKLSVLCNTGDDFVHLGLHISPDIDTVMYTLAGLANRKRGWGREDETWSFMHALRMLGGETWFRLGDGDVALHVERTRRLASGESLSTITASFCDQLQIHARLLPMCDTPMPTIVLTAIGPMPLQRYFVAEHCEPEVHGFRFDGAEQAYCGANVHAALTTGSPDAIVIAPSNPYISIDPILAVPGLKTRLQQAPAPVIVISPIIGNRAIKGPTAKIMRELGVPITTISIATHYAELADGIVLDKADANDTEALDLPCLVTDTLMRDDQDKRRLAREVLHFADTLKK